MRFAGKIAIVTGGASGIGRSVVELLASEGAAVAINDINVSQAEELCSAICAGGGKAITIAGDASDRKVAETLVSEVIAKLGHVDILVNNAGMAHSAPAIDYAVWDEMINLDLSGPFHWSRAVAAQSMIGRRTGSIVNVASLAAMGAYPGDIGYIAAKHGLAGMTKALAIEWGTYRIRVNCVCPGLTNTPILAEVERISPGRFKDQNESTPLGRMVEPIEQARVIAFLASDDASAVSGAILPVDGGKAPLLAGMSLGPVEDPITPPPFQPNFSAS